MDLCTGAHPESIRGVFVMFLADLYDKIFKIDGSCLDRHQMSTEKGPSILLKSVCGNPKDLGVAD